MIGAGPVGLLTALGIAKTGASVLVIEAGAALNDSPRAMTYTEPTLVLMNRLGIRGAANKIAVHNRHINFVWPNDDLVITIDKLKAEPERTYPENLQFGQEVLGQIARDALLTYPATEIRFNIRLKSLTQGAGHVTLTVTAPDGDIDLRAGFAIGRDGGTSVTRKLLGLEFEGHTWPESFVATNLYYDFSARGWANIHMICSGPHWGLVAKINIDKGGLWRVTFPAGPRRGCGRRVRFCSRSGAMLKPRSRQAQKSLPGRSA